MFLEKNDCLSCANCGIVVLAINPIDFEPVGFYQENKEEVIFQHFDNILDSFQGSSDDEIVNHVVEVCGYSFDKCEIMLFKKFYDQKRMG